MAFTAAFVSDCENCDVTIKEGDSARMLDFDKGLVAHVTCPPRPRENALCAACWTTHAGECM